MSKWLAETELLQNIARNLLQSRQEHYSEEAISNRSTYFRVQNYLASVAHPTSSQDKK
jgi:hypothetical protein